MGSFFSKSFLQDAEKNLARSLNRSAELWGEYGQKTFHYGFIPAVIVGGLAYSKDLRVCSLLSALNPLIL